jgi:hypothetical protein
MERQLILVFSFGPVETGNEDSEQSYRLLWGHQMLQQVEGQARKTTRSIDEATDLLRVINSKSENFTLRVAARPRAPVASPWPQTLSTSGCSSAASAS